MLVSNRLKNEAMGKNPLDLTVYVLVAEGVSLGNPEAGQSSLNIERRYQRYIVSLEQYHT